MTEGFQNRQSPNWSWTTKLVVGLSLVAIFGWLILRFREFLGPLILAFMLTYLGYPVARSINKGTNLSWRLSVTLLYFIVILVLIGLVTLGGLAILDQGQSLFQIVQQAILVTLPNLITDLSTHVYSLGRFTIDLTRLDLQAVNNQILATVQPLLGQVGGLLTKIATSTATFFGWVSFILLISYFITAESAGNLAKNMELDIPGYSGDLRRLMNNLNQIWSTFLRGQFVLFLLTIVVFTIVFTIYGVHYSLGLAIISGFGRFLPYIGPFIAWTTLGLVAYFQGSTLFGMSSLGYVVMVVGTAVIIDSIFDNIISPRFFGASLKVHPAAVLVTALVSANVIGIIGVLVAAPLLASLQLLGRYILRKMFDLDPWVGSETQFSEGTRPVIPEWAKQIWLKAVARVRVWRQQRESHD